MRDLYKRLGISPESESAEIAKAISQCDNAKIREDAATVLMEPGRRRQYDRVHSALRTIGELRARLGVTHSDHWQGTAASDFASDSPTHVVSQTEALNQKLAGLVKRQRLSNAWNRVVYGFRASIYLLVVGGFLYMMFKGFTEVDSGSGSTDQLAKPAPAAKPVFNQKPSRRPAHGYFRRYTSTAPVAQFRINTPDTQDYWVKLVRAYDNQPVVATYVHGGRPLTIKVPLGSYVMKYASGKTWYGEKYAFGPEGYYAKSDRIFEFKREDTYNGYRITGIEVTLYRVAHGNLRTRPIDMANF